MNSEHPAISSFSSELSENSPEKFGLIIQHYNQFLFRIGMGYLKELEDVEDAMQNTWLKAFENIQSFKQESKFSTWLCRIMINECLMIIRKLNKKYSLTMQEEMSYSDSGDLNQDLTKQQVIKWLEEALIEIPNEYRSVYIFREVEGLSTEETADLLKISSGNVKVRLHRAKKMLKEELMTRVPASELFEYHRRFCDKLTASVMRKIIRKL